MHDLRTISFFSDYGVADESAGIVRAIMHRVAPAAHIVDITHGIAPFDIRGASLTVARSLHALASGVVLVVVDPGVAVSSRPIAVEVAGADAVLVGPDNGVLAPAAAMLGGVKRAVALDDPSGDEVIAVGIGARVYGPCAARIAGGEDIESLGTPIDPQQLVPAMVTFATLVDDGVACSVTGVDHYGNAHLDVSPDMIESLGEVIRVQRAEAQFTVRTARAYGDAKPGETVLLVNASGMLSIACDQASAAARHTLRTGTELLLSAGV